ncbi:Phosphatidylinositol transfer protein SFH5 [Grifola frondosa]|uniref:Phosphatidylinositol transfer protein SFH5 n=1 Tax=Grifola frondosa TaxID=5627 RepID=A0A1C7LQ27_GRIFR|nr:Phosphatidylinositol transfer protein SFH5 [Grifola frondosa]
MSQPTVLIASAIEVGSGDAVATAKDATITEPSDSIAHRIYPEPVSTTQVEEEEPQNFLTEQFTKDEWKALKELRTQLPDIFSEAYIDQPDRKAGPITLWGVQIDPAGRNDARASVILMKFLRARNLSVKEAHEMLVATLRWRDEWKIDEIMKEQFSEEVFGKLGRICGKDHEGRPVAYNLYGANKDMKAVFGDVKLFLRWRIQFMEKSIELLDFQNVDQMVQIHDYEGVSLTQRDANQKAAAQEASSIFQNHYPELLSRKFFINVPMLLTWIFWLFKPLISAKTLAKMSVVGNGPETIGAALLPVIDASELPRRYGGQAADLL